MGVTAININLVADIQQTGASLVGAIHSTTINLCEQCHTIFLLISATIMGQNAFAFMCITVVEMPLGNICLYCIKMFVL
jgi:hypothetical protein